MWVLDGYAAGARVARDLGLEPRKAWGQCAACRERQAFLIFLGIAAAVLVARIGRELVFHGYSPSRDELMVEMAGCLSVARPYRLANSAGLARLQARSAAGILQSLWRGHALDGHLSPRPCRDPGAVRPARRRGACGAGDAGYRADRALAGCPPTTCRSRRGCAGRDHGDGARPRRSSSPRR